MRLKLKPRAIVELDSLRFFAVSLVVLHHQQFHSNKFFQWFTDYGHIGVDIFFVISGFIITLGLLRESEKKGRIDLKNFWIRRMLRLWPTWFLALLASSIILLGLGRDDPAIQAEFTSKFWHYFLHFGNYSLSALGKIHIVFNHFWTLAVEEHFYILWPLMFAATTKSRKWRLIALGFAITLPYFFRVFHGLQSPLSSSDFINFSTHTRFDGLAYGCLLACFFDKNKVVSRRFELGIYLVLGTLFYLGLYVLGSKDLPMALQQLSYSSISIASCLLIVIALNGHPLGLRGVFRMSSLSRLGLLSYGVYLFHPHWNFVYFFVLDHLHWNHVPDAWSATINFVVPYFPAYLLYMTVEKYFEKKKRAFR